MVDIGIKDNLKTYFNGTLAGTPNQVYDEIVNWEIVKPTHRERKSPNSFMLRKRKGFRQAFNAINGTITDIQDLEAEGEIWRFYYTITDTTYRVYKRKLSDCEAPTQIDTGDRCPNMFSKFIRTDFVKGPRRKINTANVFSHDANLINDTSYPQAIGNIASNTYNWGGGSNAIEAGDYMRVYDSIGDAVPSQVRKIISRVASGYNSRDTLNVDAPRAMTAAPTDSGALYSIFPEWGDVLVYAGQDSGYMGASSLNCGKIIHSPYSIDSSGVMNETTTITLLGITIDTFGSQNKCITSMVEHNQSILINYDTGYTAYGAEPNNTGGNGYYKFYHTVSQQIFWGKDITELVSFRNFIVGFGKNTIKAATMFDGPTYLEGNRFDLRDNLGIRNAGAHAQFDNSMRFIASNKRLYSISINSDGDIYVLELNDQSGPIIGYLDQIVDGDEVYMDVNENQMSIYNINQTSGGQYDGHVSLIRDADFNYKTRIIIFDKDYSLVHTWQTRRAIRGKYKDEYMSSSGVYHNCGYRDGDGFYEAKIGATIGDSEPTPTETNIFEKKSINRGKVVLGDGIYNNSYTYFKVFCYENGNKTVRYVSGLGNNSYLSQRPTWVTTGATSAVDCWIGDGEEALYTGELGGRDWVRDVEDSRCGPGSYSCPDYIEENKGGNRIKSPLDRMSRVIVAPIPLTTNPSDIIRIEFVSRGGDVATFGGMFWEVQKLPFDQMEGYGQNVLIDDTCFRAYSGGDLA